MTKFFKNRFKRIATICVILSVLLVSAKLVCQNFSVPHNFRFKTTEKFSGETLEGGLNSMGFLVTSEYRYTHAATYEKSRSLFTIKEFPGTKSKFIYICDGVISAGVDFEKIKLEADEKDDTITISITMPQAEIKYSELDLDSFKVLDEEKSIFNPITVEDVKNSFADVKTDEENKAKEKGLLENAASNAQTLIENFLKSSVGSKQCTINFENPTKTK